LETKEGEKEVCKLVRARERSTTDLGVVRCIKVKNGRVLLGDAKIKGKWQRYFFRLLNGEASEDLRSTSRERNEMGLNLRLGEPISRDEIKEVLKRMPNGRQKDQTGYLWKCGSAWVRRDWSG